MQSKDGGWAAFDVDNNWAAAQRRALRRPQRDARPDLPGHHRARAGSAVHVRGSSPDHPAVRRGVEYLLRTQEQDGSWYGRWGVDYIYGTFLALRGLRAAGESDREAHILRAGEWLRSVQNADGGWGESCASYDNDTFMRGREHGFADRLGGAGAARGRRRLQPQRAAGRRVPGATRSATTDPGTRMLAPARASPRSST